MDNLHHAVDRLADATTIRAYDEAFDLALNAILDIDPDFNCHAERHGMTLEQAALEVVGLYVDIEAIRDRVERGDGTEDMDGPCLRPEPPSDMDCGFEP